MERTNDQVDMRVAGVPISIKGLNMCIFLALCLMTAYMIYYLSIITSRDHTAMTQAITELAKAQSEQNYIILADEKETEEIRRSYKMPLSLKRKLRGDE